MRSILLALRDAAKTCSDAALRQHLKDLADEMSGHLTRMTACPCAPTMQDVNGCFVRAANALKLHHLGPDTPQGGSLPLTQEQLAA